MIFARAPQRGAVKRRLARDIGAGPAYEFYARISRELVGRLGRDRRWRLTLAVTPDRFATGSRFWGGGRVCITQGPGDLGQRLGNVIRGIAPGPVVIIGSDAPDVAPLHVDCAFKALAAHEVVFGPAVDGGYWLIGLARKRIAAPTLAASLFRGVRWSTAYALDDTRANLPPRAEAPPLAVLEDVDDAASWQRYRESLCLG